jgi:hypothetical protein
MWQTLINFFKSYIPKKLKSGTAECPLSINLFKSMLDEFLTLEPADTVLFESKGKKCWAKLSWFSGDIFVTLRWPYKNHPEKVFAEKGTFIPEWWGIHKFKKKRKVTFYVGLNRANTIPGFLDDVFKKIYDCKEETVIYGKSILNSKHTL